MSKQKLGSIVSSLLDGMGTLSKSETIVGEPQKAGEATVIPVHRLKVAFGAGTARAGAHGGKLDGDTGGQGAGGAVELDPIAAIAVGKDGHAHLLTVEGDSGNTWANLIAEVPDLVTRVAQTLGERAVQELGSRKISAREVERDEGAPELAEKSEE
ncbi:MAG: spore germination protein GerW family protein [Polyangiaceae bacterium]